MISKNIKAIFLSLLFLIPINSVFANDGIECVSPALVRVLEDAIGKTAALFTDSRYVQKAFTKGDGRRVLSLKSLDPGVPKKWELPDSDSYVNIRKMLEGGASNLDLMKAGYAPIGPDGKQIELHHLFGEEPGPIAELEKTIHSREHGALHQMIEGSFRHDAEKRRSWRRFRNAYWKERAKDFM